MTRFVAAIYLLISVGCVHTPELSKDITLNEATDLHLEKTTKNEVEAKFGSDFKKEIQGNEEVWTYYEPTHRYQRLTLGFDKKNILQWALWVPHSQDDGLNLEFIKRQFPGLSMDAKSDPHENPHDADGRVVYRDETAGVAVTYHTGRNEVEGVVWYDPSIREPAASHTKRRYTL